MLQLGQEVAYEEMSDYLDELLSSSDVAVSLPDDVLNEIREEMQIALEEKVWFAICPNVMKAENAKARMFPLLSLLFWALVLVLLCTRSM